MIFQPNMHGRNKPQHHGPSRHLLQKRPEQITENSQAIDDSASSCNKAGVSSEKDPLTLAGSSGEHHDNSKNPESPFARKITFRQQLEPGFTQANMIEKMLLCGISQFVSFAHKIATKKNLQKCHISFDREKFQQINHQKGQSIKSTPKTTPMMKST